MIWCKNLQEWHKNPFAHTKYIFMKVGGFMMAVKHKFTQCMLFYW